MKSIKEIIESINTLGISEGHFTIKDGHLTYEVTFDESMVDITTTTDEEEGTAKVYRLSRDGSALHVVKGYQYAVNPETAELLLMIDSRQLDCLKKMAALIRDHAIAMETAVRGRFEEMEVEVMGVVPPFTIEIDFSDTGKVQVAQEEWWFYWDELSLEEIELSAFHPFPHQMIDTRRPFTFDIDWEMRDALLNALIYYRKHLDGSIPYYGWLHVRVQHLKLIIYPNGHMVLADKAGMSEPMEMHELTAQLGGVVSDDASDRNILPCGDH